ncbi:uncharacterized protein LOC143275469 isoform X2 [Babylonia areolata]|uniref:uncharacterized protein LOC143275469 isoform X2 n=1 Tax=Babylonia areolata TaxID=304850 RepID=UPI003FD22B56
MAEERDSDHEARQGLPLFVDTFSSKASTYAAGQTGSGVPPLPFNHRTNSYDVHYSTYPSLEQRTLGFLGAHTVPVPTSVPQRLDSLHADVSSSHGDLVSPHGEFASRPLPDQRRSDPQTAQCGFFPPCEQRKSPMSGPARRSTAVSSSSLPLRSPKRIISFDFPNNMDPRRVEEIHRQIVQMAHEAGMSDSVKIVEEPQEEEEPLPIIQLQDPPKPKFKRQLSADNSPPDKLSAAIIPSVTARSAERVQHGQLASSLAGDASAHVSHEPTTLSLMHAGAYGEGSSYTPSTHSPKRLRSEPSVVPCTSPKSPKKSTTPVAETTLDRRGGQVDKKTVTFKQNKDTDVVHIFPLLGKDRNDANNNDNDSNSSADRTKVKDPSSVHSSSASRLDETDSRQRHKESNIVSGDVDSVLNVRQPRPTDMQIMENTSHAPHFKPTLKPQESIQTLQMLFGRKEETLESTNEKSSRKKTLSDLDQQIAGSDTESESSMPKDVTSLSAEDVSQTPDRSGDTDQQFADKHFRPLTMPSSTQPRVSLLPGLSTKSTPKKTDDILTCSDPYMAELAGRLQDMQRKIFSQHVAFTEQTEDRENQMGADTGQKRTANQEREHNTTSASKMSASAVTVGSHDLSTEEESRTARLCRSKSNPFTFSSGDIEKAKAVLSNSDPVSLIPTDQSGQEERGRFFLPESSGAKEETQGGQFRLGDLWISSRESQMNHRQLSDPGTRLSTSKLNPVLEKVKPTTLRQFSEPVRSQNSNQGKQESDEFQKNPKQACRRLQQQICFQSENYESVEVMEGHPTYFLEDEDKGESDMMKRNCPTSKNQVVNPSFPQQSPMACFEMSRKHQPFDEFSVRERRLGRDLGDHFWQTYRQTPYWPSCGEHGATSSAPWIPSPRQQIHGKERAAVSFSQAVEDDSVFEDISVPDRGSPFKNPTAPLGFGERGMDRSSDRSSSLLSPAASPRRPALRSQSNVEQSPNKAELEAMAHYKYLRSFSEHISDPKRLMEQLRAMPPADCDHLLEQLQGRRRVDVSTSFSGDKDADRSACNRNNRHKGVRRTLFQDADMMTARSYDLAEWQQQGCYTYPPPLARRQSFSSAHDLRRSQSWIRDNHSGASTSRQPGDLDVTLECTQAMAATHHQNYTEGFRPLTAQHPEILRRKIETYIQQILKNHLRIRPSGSSQADMDLWIAQAAEIERLTEEASQLIGTLNDHNRSVYDVLTGSVVIRVNCSTLLGVLDLWEKFESGALQRLVGRLFGGEKMVAVTGMTGVELKVSLCYFQYTACLDELGSSLAAETAIQSPRRSESLSSGCVEKPLSLSSIKGTAVITSMLLPHVHLTFPLHPWQKTEQSCFRGLLGQKSFQRTKPV